MYNKPFHTADISKSSFLVTGGAGFIGSNIVEYLIKYGAGKVRVIDNLSTGFRKNIEPFISGSNFEFIEQDICNIDNCYNACAGMDYVLHEAAIGSVPRSIEDPVTTNNSNVTGFLNILVAAKKSKIKRIVFASSSSVYGDSEVSPKKEEKTGNPLSPYAVSKVVNELYAAVFARNYNMEIIGLRYFNIFGPKQNPEGPYAAVIPLFIEALLNNKSPLIYGDGEQTRDFTFVENAVQANIKAIFCEDKKTLSRIYNIAYGGNITINKLFDVLKNQIRSNITPVYKKERQGDIRHSFADISKAKSVLNYNPGINIEQGLKLTIDWFKESL